MTVKRFTFRLPLVFGLASIVGAQSFPAGADNPGSDHTSSSVHTITSAGSQPTEIDLQGTWSGAFQSEHADVSPFTITILISRDPKGNVVGATSSAADCFKDGSLQVTVKGSKVLLAGSDPEGNNITFRGSLDSTGTLLNLNYVLNSSASGMCESDDGSGTLGKR